MNRPFALTASLLFLVGAAALSLSAEPPATKQPTADSPPSEAAIERSRKTVRMLDEVYKQTIVLVTDKYVHDTDDFAAGSAAVLLFKNISKSGNQQVRLLDATGEPYEPENVAKDAFEKEGIKRIKAGATFYDEVVKQKGKYELRAMTPVPVVMQKCVMCHAHYADAKKKGEAIGAISYIVPID
ncbi:MAG TPA: DUF3365 domain-containing protein [Pirellulaceae bacterium]|nr:DUF3365 domain-containing protein [Pirellulaceae bacterium]